MTGLTSDPIFGFTLCIGAYTLALAIKRKFNYTLLNPMMVGSIIIIAVLLVFKIPLTDFMNGAKFITMFLAPATAALAVSMYHQIDILRKNLVPILVGSIVGAGSALASIFILCKVFNLTPEVTASLLPKSITTAFASKLSEQLGGMVPITIAAVCVTGILGAIGAPYFIKWFRIDNPIASGLAIGASSHALGTTKAIEIGEAEGSVSGIAVGLCGIITVLIAIFL